MSDRLATLHDVERDAFDTLRQLLARKKLGEIKEGDDPQAGIRLETARLAALKAALGVGRDARAMIARASGEGAPAAPKS